MLINIKDNQEKIKKELDRRVSLVASSLVGTFLSGYSPDNTSFRHMLNRLMILVQAPLSFVLFREEDFGGRKRYRCKYNFNNNKRDQVKIKECIISENASGECLFNLFGTDYYLLVMKIGKDKGEHAFEAIRNNNKNQFDTTNNLICYQLNSIFSIQLYENYGNSFKKGMVEACIDDIEKTYSKRGERSWVLGDHESGNPYNNDSLTVKEQEQVDELQEQVDELHESKLSFYFKNFDTALLSNMYFLTTKGQINLGHFDRIHGNVQRGLRRITQMSVDAADEEKDLASYIVFVRDFAKGTNFKRLIGDYGYDLKIMIGSKQEEEIRKHFRSLKKYKSTVLYTDSLDPNHHHYVQIKEIAEGLDNYFWSSLENKSGYELEGSIDEFVNILKSPFNSRSVADGVFSDAVIFFRKPFADGGIGRSFKLVNERFDFPKWENLINEKSNHSHVLRDLKRLVIAFYWYNGMVNKSKSTDTNVDLSMMLIPIEVGNRIWAVVGYFTKTYKDNGKKEKIDLETDIGAWNTNYHIFQEIASRIKSDVRLSLAALYKQMVSFIYAETIIKDIPLTKKLINLSSNDEKKNLIAFELNSRFEILSKFFPYETVKVLVKDGCATPSKSDALSGGSELLGVHTDEKAAETAGVYMSPNFHCELLREDGNGSTSLDNVYFPRAPLSRGLSGLHHYVNPRDLEVMMTNALLQELWKKTLQDRQNELPKRSSKQRAPSLREPKRP